MTNSKIKFLSGKFLVLFLILSTLGGCNESLTGPMHMTDGGMIDSDAAMTPDAGPICFDPRTGDPTGECDEEDAGVEPDSSTPSGTATLVATLKSGVTFVVTGTSVEGVSCEAPFIVQATNVSHLAGPSCTVNGQTVTCTNVPKEVALDLRSCIRDAAGVIRVINLSAQSEGCPLQRNEWSSVKADGVELDNTVGIDTDSSPALYCRIEL